MEYHIRPLAKAEYTQATRLAFEVFVISAKEDFDEEGLESFKSFIDDEKLTDQLTIYGSFDKEKLIGILALKNGHEHISLFFIRPEYHRRGIGKALFQYAETACPSAETTVNSSTYAIPFYQSLGFAVIGPKQNYHGLCSTPMRRYHAVIVQKENYTLRTWRSADAPSLARNLNNKKIWDNCRDALPYPYTLADAEAFIDMITKKEGIHDFCIEVEGKAVGNIGFVPQTDVERFNAEAGYVIGEEYWNRGIMTDALREAVRYYFAHTDKVRIFAIVFEHNLPSMRVLEKAGFTKVGVLTKSVFKNGHFTDTLLFELLKI